MLLLGCDPVSSGPAASRQSQARQARGVLRGRSATDPVFGADFPDPSVMQDADGQWYAFGTEGNGKQVQAATAEAKGGAAGSGQRH